MLCALPCAYLFSEINWCKCILLLAIEKRLENKSKDIFRKKKTELNKCGIGKELQNLAKEWRGKEGKKRKIRIVFHKFSIFVFDIVVIRLFPFIVVAVFVLFFCFVSLFTYHIVAWLIHCVRLVCWCVYLKIYIHTLLVYNKKHEIWI